MKLTKRQRAQVVELLRCAADRAWLLFDTKQYIGCAESTLRHAVVARRRAREALKLYDAYGAAYATTCLEAAQLVEEGAWL